jgi:hypothetical protein
MAALACSRSASSHIALPEVRGRGEGLIRVRAKGNNLKGFQDFYLKAKASIWS